MRNFKNLIKRIICYLFGIYYLIIYLILGNMKSKKLSNLKYNSLYCISFVNKKVFRKYKNKLEILNLNNLKEKKEINIGFVTYTPTMWSVDKLYKKLNLNERFKASIIVPKFKTVSKNSMEKNFEETVSYFSNKNYNCITPYDTDFDISTFDILIYMTPYEVLPNFLNVRNIKCNKLICYVSYSFMLANKREKFNLPIYFLSWRYFCDSLFYKNLIQKESRIYTENVRYFGYPKMDSFYIEQSIKKREKKKIIIYAPHHSLMNDRIGYSTFDKNCYIMLELAKKYRDETFWVYKPHPLLRAHAVKSGVFKNESEYDAYVSGWKNLNNAKIIENESYIETFKISDAMITDSVSFLAEYQYVKKPLLLLENKDTSYNQFGESIRDIVYKCYGYEYGKIEAFINLVINEKDPMSSKRDTFFSINLDYFSENKMLANDSIYYEILGFIEGNINENTK